MAYFSPSQKLFKLIFSILAQELFLTESGNFFFSQEEFSKISPKLQELMSVEVIHHDI